MSFIDRDRLPFEGTSYEFAGEKEGAPISAYIVNAKPGQGPPLHTHHMWRSSSCWKAALLSPSATKSAKYKRAPLLWFPRTLPIDSSILALDCFAKSTFTQARNLFRRISSEG